MNIFKIFSINKEWPTNFKKYETIIVRAESEAAARKLVKRTTFTTQQTIPIRPNPWLLSSDASCVVYEGADFSKDGEEEVLFPEQLRDIFLNLG